MTVLSLGHAGATAIGLTKARQLSVENDIKWAANGPLHSILRLAATAIWLSLSKGTKTLQRRTNTCWKSFDIAELGCVSSSSRENITLKRIMCSSVVGLREQYNSLINSVVINCLPPLENDCAGAGPTTKSHHYKRDGDLSSPRICKWLV